MSMEPLHITLLSGFLGSGKTTLLKGYLKEVERPIGVIVNEAGEIDIDGAFLEHINDNLCFESIPSGCLCCTARAEIVNKIGALLDRAESAEHHIESIIIELSGLAVPVPVINAISQFKNWDRDVVISTVCVFDCLNGLGMMDAHPEVQEQLAIADVVVLTKQDLADSGLLLRAKSLIGTVAPLGVVVDEGDVQRRGTQAMSVIPPAGGSARVLQNCDSLGGRFVVENHQHSAVRSVAFASEGARDHEEFRWRLEQIVYQLGEDLLRMKAIIRVGAGSKALLFQTVGVTFSDPVIARLEPRSPSVLVFLVRSTFDPTCFGLLDESIWKRQRA